MRRVISEAGMNARIAYTRQTCHAPEIQADTSRGKLSEATLAPRLPMQVEPAGLDATAFWIRKNKWFKVQRLVV